MSRLDEKLIRGLNAVGFRTDNGTDGTGYLMKYLRDGGGYYINVGCSELIVEGKIQVVESSTIKALTGQGAILHDGNTLDVDLIVFATGYMPIQESVRRFFGDDIAERVGPIWGFGEGEELRNMFRKTAQPGLWFLAGSFSYCRMFSKFLALQIKAEAEGILPRGRG